MIINANRIIRYGFLLLLLALFSCTAGVDIGKADRVLTSFTIVWPDGFVFVVNDKEQVNVTIKALDQYGELFAWSGLVDINNDNSNVAVGPPTVTLTNGSAQTLIEFNNILGVAQNTKLIIEYKDIVTFIENTIQVLGS